MAMSTTDLLEQMLDPVVDCLTPEAARTVVSLRAPAEMQARLDQLADRANEGLLTPSESADYEKFRATFHVLTLFQSKARQLLSAQQSS
jgi:hypothetical protein